MGFPFSNFYLPSGATATVCWPVNLPIIAHSVGEEEDSLCKRVSQGQGCSLALYICCGNTCRDLTKELFKLPADAEDKETKKTILEQCVRRYMIDCAFVCIHWSVCTFPLHSVCFLYVCMHK